MRGAQARLDDPGRDRMSGIEIDRRAHQRASPAGYFVTAPPGPVQHWGTRRDSAFTCPIAVRHAATGWRPAICSTPIRPGFAAGSARMEDLPIGSRSWITSLPASIWRRAASRRAPSWPLPRSRRVRDRTADPVV
jgi:hypothetical protein